MDTLRKLSLSDEHLSNSIILTRKHITSIVPMSEIMKQGKAVKPADIEGKIGSLSEKEKRLFDKLMTRDHGESKYEIVKKVATGGMGDVYYVYDKDIRRYSILKVISEEIKDKTDHIRQFIFEARITGELEHPNIVPMHDFGYLYGYGIYYTMTFIDGESLTDLVDHNRYVFRSLLRVFRKVCDAVSYAHSKDIIHRDIKPDNIMVGKFGEVVLVDWGLAKRLGADNDVVWRDGNLPAELEVHNKTVPGELKGSPFYMSPEQASGNVDEVDKQTDIFLLGATLYHIFTHSAPYEEERTINAVMRAAKGDFVPPENVYSGKEQLPRDLWRIINKAMAADKRDRYESIEEFIKDLDELIDGKMTHGTLFFEKGEVLLEEGQVGENCFIIISGKVEVYKADLDGIGRINLGVLGACDIVGEMALITDQPRTATAVALERTEVAVLNRRFFTQNLKKLPVWMEMSINALANRLSDTTVKFTDSIVMQRDVDIQEHPFSMWGCKPSADPVRKRPIGENSESQYTNPK